MANRADRRRKQQPSRLPTSQEKLIRRFEQNGITMKDLEKEYYKGLEAGRDSAIKTCYAAVCLAARDELGFGAKRAYRLLCTMDRHVCDTLSSVEAIDRVLSEMGITIRFHEPFDRIEQKE